MTEAQDRIDNWWCQMFPQLAVVETNGALRVTDAVTGKHCDISRDATRHLVDNTVKALTNWRLK